jgi:hypothetical protein
MAENAIDLSNAAGARGLGGLGGLDGLGGADLIGAVAAESNEELAAGLEEDFRQMTAAQGRILVRLGEFDRRQGFRDEGATSVEAWSTERFGVSAPTARALAHVGAVAWNLPHLVGALCEGALSFDKVRVLADVATPESDAHLCEQAKASTVRELADIARTTAERQAADRCARARSEHDRRSLRFNDAFRTVTAQLPAESYAEAKACLEAVAREIPSDDESETALRWDQRLCDAFKEIIRSRASGTSKGARAASPFFVVAHVALGALVHESGEAAELAGELEHDGLIDTETVQKLACEGTLAIAVDDDVGHTMYEGRARRLPTGAQRREVRRRDRRCRFPGCANVTFADVHHIVPWKLGGLSDLDNLALLCRHHHGVVHRKGWTMTGNANEELTFCGPTGRVMTSRPSPLWTRITAGRRAEASG